MAQVIVPDASVILKWVLNSSDEGDRDNAILLLNLWLDGNIEIVLPKLWSFEVGNVLMLNHHDIAEEVMEVFIGYGFSEFDMTYELCKETLGLMKKYNVTFYDAVYHAVAILKNGLLVTADDTYYRKVRESGNIIRLRDWK